MTSPLNEKNPAADATTRATMTIVGGGATGGAIFAEAVQEAVRVFKSDLKAPPLTIRLYESGGQYGYGVPYDLLKPVFRLNQPASRMSIYDNNPGHFVSWLESREAAKNVREVAEARAFLSGKEAEGLTDAQLANHYPAEYVLSHDWHADDFVPRSYFRQYLEDQFRAARATADKVNADLGREAIRIETIDAMMSTVGLHQGDVIVLKGVTADGSVLESETDSLVIATGHHKNKLFAQFKDTPGYADTPFTLESISEIVGGEPGTDKTAFILGTSQSMLDALAGLDACGFKGKIIASSSDAIEPWPWVPALHRQERTDYQFECLTTLAITALIEKHGTNVAMIVDGVRALMAQELHSEKALREGARHVLTTFRAQKSQLEDLMKSCPGLYPECIDLADKFDGNHTYDERFAAYKKFKQDGQLEIMRGRADPVNTVFNKESGDYMVVVNDTVAGRDIGVRADLVLNCASMQRAPYRRERGSNNISAVDKFIQTAVDSGLVTADDKTQMLEPAPDFANGTVNLAGPAKSSGWGVPYTKYIFDDVAREGIRRAVSRTCERITASMSLTP